MKTLRHTLRISYHMQKGPVTKVKALMGWDNKGALQHMAKMSYMTERADRMDGIGVSTWFA